jgi:hypothetical protein
MIKIIIFVWICFLNLSTGQAQDLQIYGGESHDVYLGCLNCNQYDPNSIWNSFGKYGSQYNSNSVWNQFGTYGSEYSKYSPWNLYATDPPVIVDKDGAFYGYLTVNEYADKRAKFELALTVCKYYNLIRKDVSGWYDKIFD